MVTGYEREYYQNVGRIAAALERIADALEADTRANAEPAVEEHTRAELDEVTGEED